VAIDSVNFHNVERVEISTFKCGDNDRTQVVKLRIDSNWNGRKDSAEINIFPDCLLHDKIVNLFKNVLDIEGDKENNNDNRC
jgi:hypothetical protein